MRKSEGKSANRLLQPKTEVFLERDARENTSS